jgi:TonB family protein
MSSTTSGLLSQMRERRAERKKPKRFVALKKVSLDPSQQSHISEAQANLPKHPITQKNIKQSSTAFTVAMLFHVLIAIFIATYVIVDRIELAEETFDVSMVVEESKTKRRLIRRKTTQFDSKTQQQKPVFKQPVRTNTAQLPSKDGFTIPEGPGTTLDLTTPDTNEGPPLIDVNRSFVKPTTTIEPETKAPGFELERNAPTLIDKLDTPDANAAPGLDNINFTPEPGVVPPKIILAEKKYPERAKKAGKEGQVILQLTIDEKGIPKDIVPLTNLGFGLEEAAIELLKRSTFRPATKGGEPISLLIEIPIDFKLKGE